MIVSSLFPPLSFHCVCTKSLAIVKTYGSIWNAFGFKTIYLMQVFNCINYSISWQSLLPVIKSSSSSFTINVLLWAIKTQTLCCISRDSCPLIQLPLTICFNQMCFPVRKKRGRSSLALAVLNSSLSLNLHCSSSSSLPTVCLNELRSAPITHRVAPTQRQTGTDTMKMGELQKDVVE